MFQIFKAKVINEAVITHDIGDVIEVCRINISTVVYYAKGSKKSSLITDIENFELLEQLYPPPTAGQLFDRAMEAANEAST